MRVLYDIILFKIQYKDRPTVHGGGVTFISQILESKSQGTKWTVQSNSFIVIFVCNLFLEQWQVHMEPERIKS